MKIQVGSRVRRRCGSMPQTVICIRGSEALTRYDSGSQYWTFLRNLILIEDPMPKRYIHPNFPFPFTLHDAYSDDQWVMKSEQHGIRILHPDNLTLAWDRYFTVGGKMYDARDVYEDLTEGLLVRVNGKIGEITGVGLAHDTNLHPVESLSILHRTVLK